MTKPSDLSVLSLPSDQDSSGRTLGDAELALLHSAIASGTLTSTKGRFTRNLEERFAGLLGRTHAYACASGTAAIHLAIAAIDPEPGEEIVTTSITDMGAITPILYQGAIPVFADVDPATGNVTAATIEAVLSDRTRAIIVTHLFGNPADMGDIMALADRRGIPVIEDCAQAFLATVAGRQVGTFGAISCFSLQQGKHITTGEGGLVATDDQGLARRLYLLINKGWGYGDPSPDHYFIALNYRLSELQSAVAVAQLDKLADSVDIRRCNAAQLTEGLADLIGIAPPRHRADAEHSYWRYCLFIDDAIVDGGSPALAVRLKVHNVASAPRYIQKPAFQCAVIRDQKTFGTSRWPFNLARPDAVDYAPERFPGTFEMLNRVLVLPWNERYLPAHIAAITDALRAAHADCLAHSYRESRHYA